MQEYNINKVILCIILFIMIILNVLYALVSTYLTHDIYIYLNIGERILAGARPYIDYIEINLITAHYIVIPPVWVSQVTGLNLVTSYSLYMLLWIFFSAGTSFYLLNRFVDPNKQIVFIYAVPIILLLATFFVEASFGQREHILILMFIPFMITQWIRWNSTEIELNRYLLFILGFLLGICLTIKPYFFLLPISLILFWLITGRNWRLWIYPEYFGCLVAGAVYIVFLLFNWDSMQEFLVNQLPEILKNYDAYDIKVSIIGVMLKNLKLKIIINILLFLGGIWLYRRNPIASSLLLYLAITMFISALIVILQNKNFPYHYIPFNVFSYLGLVALLFYLPQSNSRFKFPIQVFMLIGIIVLSMTVLRHMIFPITYPFPDVENEVVLEYSEENDPVMGLTPLVTFSRVFLSTNRQDIGTYLTSHPISFELKQFETVDDVYIDGQPYISEQLQIYLDRVENDVVTHQPTLILIHHNCYICPRGLLMTNYFKDIGFIDKLNAYNYELVYSDQYVEAYGLKD